MTHLQVGGQREASQLDAWGSGCIDDVRPGFKIANAFEIRPAGPRYLSSLGRLSEGTS